MKNLLAFLLLLCSASVSAQDVIVKKDGSTVVCLVVELTSTEITYKKWSDLNGSNYVMDRSAASAINYENGKKEVLGEQQSQYTPGNQNDGVQQYNDRALLAMDYAASNPYKKVKTLKTIGWIGGPALAVFGAVLIAADDYDFFGFNSSDESLLGLGVIGLGAAWTTSFLLVSNHTKKKIDSQLYNTSIMQYDFPFSNNSSLSLGANLIRDNVNGKNTLGLGLRYNF